MNTLDWIVIAIIAISAIIAYYKGFLYTVFQTISTMLALYLSYMGYKPLNSMLRKTFLYDWLQKLAISNVDGLHNVMGLSEQAELISGLQLPIPSNIKENLIRHNNPEIYQLLGAHDFKEYVAGYISNFYLSIIAFIILLSIIKVIMHILGESIHIISKLPIIRFADKWLGLGVGIIKGCIWIWISTIVLAFLIVLPRFKALTALLSESILAKWFYENNLILEIIDQLFI